VNDKVFLIGFANDLIDERMVQNNHRLSGFCECFDYEFMSLLNFGSDWAEYLV